MTKPDKKTSPKAYAAWVRGKLLQWDPADDRGAADAYQPRHDGILWEPLPKGDKPEKRLPEVRATQIKRREGDDKWSK